MKKFLSHKNVQKVLDYIRAHKVISTVVGVVVIGVAWVIVGKLTATTGETRYMLGTVDRGTIVSSVTGTGQVSASTQIDLKPKASGDITYVPINDGQVVKKGALIAE